MVLPEDPSTDSQSLLQLRALSPLQHEHSQGRGGGPELRFMDVVCGAWHTVARPAPQPCLSVGLLHS